ncbi:hypothetical protein QJS66_19790 [Kocuria rhizophila]|nr:hypothetical protein QJS66_19790 [Kocuria rhizophila]
MKDTAQQSTPHRPRQRATHPRHRPGHRPDLAADHVVFVEDAPPRTSSACARSSPAWAPDPPVRGGRDRRRAGGRRLGTPAEEVRRRTSWRTRRASPRSSWRTCAPAKMRSRSSTST